MELAGYQLEELLHEDQRSAVYRARRVADKSAHNKQTAQETEQVVLKVLNVDIPSPQELQRFRREYTTLRRLELTSVVKAYSLEQSQERWCMVLEYIQGTSLAQWLQQKPCSLGAFFPLACQLSASVAEVHAAQIVHKDLNPHNIMWSGQQLKLIDFGIASHQGDICNADPGALEGTLAYMAPEQTGRMSKRVDTRSDLYALGIIFYEMLLGFRPFQGHDAMELVHAHLVKIPIAPRSINAAIPEPLSAIILKLLAKDPEDRYPSAWSLHHDLEHSWQQWQRSGNIAEFPLAQQDRAQRLRFPKRLYGRKHYIARGLEHAEALRRVPSGQLATSARFVHIAAASGQGKSALLDSLERSVQRQRCYVLRATFRQSAAGGENGIVTASRTLIGQLLLGDESSLQRWRQRLQSALGDAAPALCEQLPELRILLASSAKAPALPNAQALQRFQLAMLHLWQCLAQQEQPLLVLLDDVQWTDDAEAALLLALLRNTRGRIVWYLAYNPDDLSAAHPLQAWCQEQLAGLGEAGTGTDTAADTVGDTAADIMADTGVEVWTLRSLSPVQLAQLLRDIFSEQGHSKPAHSKQGYQLASSVAIVHSLTADDAPASDADAIADDALETLSLVLWQKTAGNPFFVRHLLQDLERESLLWYQPAGGWRWDMRRIRSKAASESIREYLASRFLALPETSQSTLQLAACLGDDFGLETLLALSEYPRSALLRALQQAEQQGLLVMALRTQRAANTVNTVQHSEDKARDAHKQDSRFSFAHRHVRHYVLAGISPEQQQRLHLRIAQQLRGTLFRDEATLLAFVQHALQAAALLSEDERLELAQCCFRAGDKAQGRGAFAEALRLFEQGLVQLGDKAWAEHYSLTLTLHKHAAEVAYLARSDAYERYCQAMQEHGREAADKVLAYEVLIQVCVAQGERQEVLHLGREAFALLGLVFPEEPQAEVAQQRVAALQQRLDTYSHEALLLLPAMQDPQATLASRLHALLSSSVFALSSSLYAVCVCQRLELLLDYGYHPLAPAIFAAYGLLLSEDDRALPQAHAMASLALQLLKRPDTAAHQARTLVVANVFVRHWLEPLAHCLDDLAAGYSNGVATGDIYFASRALWNHANMAIVVGRDLAALETDLVQQRQQAEHLGQRSSSYLVALAQQVVHNLRHAPDHPQQLRGPYFDESQLSEEFVQGNSVSRYTFYSHKLMLCYMFGQYHEGWALVPAAEASIAGRSGSYMLPLTYFYSTLLRLACWMDMDESQRQQALQDIDINLAKLQRWAHYAPSNQQHRCSFIAAERARYTGDEASARLFYDQAISQAQHYPQELALALERAGSFYHAQGNSRFAKVLLQDALQGYRRWGADAKVDALRRSYPDYLRLVPEAVTTTTRSVSMTGSSQSHSSALDLSTMMKAAQSISRSINLDKLLRNLLRIVSESAGADKVFLLLSRQSVHARTAVPELWLEASLDGERITLRQGQALENCQQLSKAIVRYVARTREPVLLHDACFDGRFVQDDYIQQHQSKSVLCLPLERQKQLKGVVYLENRLTRAAFNEERHELLSLLLAQASIALENAQLYAQQEVLVAERTQALSQALADLQATQGQLFQAKAELEVTRQIQTLLLPKHSELAAVPCLDIAGFMKSADAVGGDYYDVLQQDDAEGTRVTIGIGDVTGHGLESGLLMLMAQTAVRTMLANGERDPKRFLQVLNQALYANLERMHADKSMTLALLDYRYKPARQRGVVHLSGQHEHVLLLRADGQVEILNTIDLGFPVGLTEDIAAFLEEQVLELAPGDGLVLYTDGVTEAENQAGERYGLSRLSAVAAAYWPYGAESVCYNIMREVYDHIGEQDILDDITLLVLKQR